MIERTEYGFKRTIVNDPIEIINCENMPGFLVPEDIERIAKYLNYQDVMQWGMDHLLASPGSTVLIGTEIVQIPTLVPNRQANGHCHWLENGLCKIYSAAPFGCAFFDMQQSPEEGAKRAHISVMRLIEAHNQNHLYTQIWMKLFDMGKRAESARSCREKIRLAHERLLNDRNKTTSNT